MRYRASGPRARSLLLATLMVCVCAAEGRAQNGRVLGREDIVLLGAGLAVEPARQTVPKDIATIVSTFLAAPDVPDQPLPPFAPDAVVKATLRGPSFSGGVEITTRPNTPFNIPPLSVAGIHTLDGIRLESGGDVILRGTPESVVIEVIEKLLVTQVTARALTAEEIRERGIVFDRTNFQAYNFTAAFAVGNANPIPINFPIVLPRLQPTPAVPLNEVALPRVEVPTLPSLATIIPQTLQLQTQIPNLSVVGFTLNVPQLQGQDLFVPPIPGIIVIPGDIGFLNQYFNVTLLVGNVAPAGSGLVVSELSAEIVLPPGRDDVPDSGDDPLRMAQTVHGQSARVQFVVQPGADGRLGTADDIASLGPGDSGSAEYLVEGRREGSHVIEMEMTGTLTGLPVGPVTVRGRAAGSVLVRNPTFTLTFTHPELINAGEPYSLDVTVTNTSDSPANFVSINLYSRNVTGATVVGSPTRDIESIPPGDSATVSFDLLAQVTGPVTAATLDSDENVAGRFALKTSVGELGIPLSPDSLVLPREANSLPAELRQAALGLLGRAWAVATAPAAALPVDVSRFTKKIVFDRAIELAEAGFRYTLHEPLEDTATHLLFDYLGNGYARLAERTPAESLAYAQSDYRGFDELRRRSIRGEVLAGAVASILAPVLNTAGATSFHEALAVNTSFRAGHVSVVLSSGGPLPFTLSVFDPSGRQVGGLDAAGRVIKAIPFADFLALPPASQMAIVGSPAPGDYRIQLDRVPGAADTPFTLSILVPDASGALRHVAFTGLTAASRPSPAFAPSDPFRVTVDVRVNGASSPGDTVPPTASGVIADPAPRVLGAVQQQDADLLTCEARVWRAGRVLALLFSEELTPEAVQDRLPALDLTRYGIDGNQVVGVALQPGRRIAFLALRDPIGPLVPRNITVSGITDRLGQPMTAQTLPIEMTVEDEAGVVAGQVLNADGTPAAFSEVRLYYVICDSANTEGISTRLVTSGAGISSKTTDEQGRFQWDYVLKDVSVNRIAAIAANSDDARSVPFNVARNGQRLNVNVVFLGRGTLSGRALDESGAPLAGTAVRVTSLTDYTEHGATTDADGRFSIGRIPVGNILIEAVNLAARASGHASEYLSVANGTLSRDVTLFSDDQPQVEVRYGAMRGVVLSGDGLQGVADVPVVAWYRHDSQRGVRCPGLDPPAECAIAMVRTDTTGAFTFDRIAAGSFRVSTFDPATYQQGEAGVQVVADATAVFNILLAQGLGTVRGVVLDAAGARVAGARVGGGLSLTTTNESGEFVLVDVPVGRREIVAVSDALHASGKTQVDLVRTGDEQNVTIVLDGMGTIAGQVFQVDGVTPVANATVHVFKKCPDGCIEVVATVTTNQDGGYSAGGLKLGSYFVSSFRSDFTSGNVRQAMLRFNGEVTRADIVRRGGGGRITGVVYDDDGQTPLAAAVGISGDRVVVAGGMVGVGFAHVTNYQVAQTSISTGTFAFNDIWVGPVILRAAGQFSPDPIQFETAIPSPNASVHVELRLQPTAQISGTVFQPDGVTPVGADVSVRFRSDAFTFICNGEDCVQVPQGVQDFAVVTDAQGRYLINPVNAGRFTITVEDPATGRVAQLKGDVKPGQDAVFDARLLQLATVTIRVRGNDGVTPIPGARVELRQTGFPERQITLFAGANGDAIFGGANALAEGEFAVLATNLANGFAGRVSGAVTAGTETVTVNLFLFDQYGSVAGRVFAPDGLTPVANAEVLVTRTCVEPPCEGGGPIAFAVTDAAGSYRVDIVPLGDVAVEAFEAATSRRAYASGRVDFDDQEVPINLSQVGIGQVTGTLYQAGTLSPLKNWDVMLFQVAPNGRDIPTLRASSGIDGTFSFPGASVGAFRIRATKGSIGAVGDGDGELARHGQVVDIPVVVQVPRDIFGRIEGLVVNPDGTPAANTQVTVSGIREAPRTTTADGAGLFTFENVPVGRLTLTARSQTSLNAASLQAELAFEGETIRPTVVLIGLSTITGTVYRSDGVTPASFVALELRGDPSPGCAQDQICLGNADAAGRFRFDNVAARTFSVIAIDPIAALKGVVGDAINPGEVRDVRIVLEPSATVTGRMLLPGNVPAQGAVAEVIVPRAPPDADLHLFSVAGADGRFTFPAVPSGGPRTFNFADPIGPGVAARTVQVLAGTQSLGDVLLDVGPPAIASSSPSSSATGVALNSPVRLVFNEPVAPGTVTQANVTLAHGGGPVAAILAVDQGDTRVTITPLAPLAEKTLYTVTVRNVADRFGKAMTTSFALGFTTVDLTPPATTGLSPGANTNGAPIYAPIRISFSEPIDVSRFAGPALSLFDGSAPVDGRIDFTLGNTVVVFTPLRPLREDALYRVTGLPAADLSGNLQPQGLDYTFTTTDRTPPVITALIAAGNGTVIENAVTQVVAQVAAGHDVAFVDFYVSGILTATARTEPFVLNLLARPDLAAPGQQIDVAAVATDTSGNRGTSPVGTSVTVIADTAPAVSILSPAPDAAVENGQRVNVTVRVTDDLGATQLGYRADTGRPQDAATLALAPPATVREETFGFNVPQNALPGSRLRITASALDTKGQAAGAEISLLVLDAVAPTVAITGTTTGARVRPGQDTLVVVSAQDAGLIREIAFESTGIVARSEVRAVNPAQPDVATSFTIHVPETANPGDVIVLRARAVDVAGNTSDAAPVTLPVADLNGPTVTLRTANGLPQAVPGLPLTVIVDAEDETGVARVDLSGQGAFTLSDARAISPPIASASATFTINVPATATPGSTLTLAATATDLFGNAGAAGTLVLTMQAAAGVTLPASLLTMAGEETEFTVTLADPAPAGGLSVALATNAPGIASPISPVIFAAGQSTQVARLLSIAGGNATITASIQGVVRASMTVTVQGGVVRGTVVDPSGQPVAGAQVSVTQPLRTTLTDANGQYVVQGIFGGPSTPVVVKVIDPVTRFIGYASGALNVSNGSAQLNVVLIAAGRIGGTVLLPDGETPAGANVRVDLLLPVTFNNVPLQTVFTGEDGRYEFPIVTLGTYRVEASDTAGNRGRATAVLNESGDEIDVPVQYLGRGVVSGTVSSGGTPVPNAALRFYASSIFGDAPQVIRNAEADGTFRFEGVLVGTFTVQAHDPVSNTAGSASGQISLDGQSVTANVSLASYGSLGGRVYRSDGVTPVAGATVRVNAPGATIRTTTDENGNYAVTFVPLGSYSIEATEPSTRGIARLGGSLGTHLESQTRDLVFLPQGTVIVTVFDFNGARVPGARVSVGVQSGSIFDSFSLVTDATGVAIFENVLAGTVQVTAFANGLSSPQVSATLGAGGVVQLSATLEPSANIVGTLFGPDGQTPVGDGFVSIDNGFNRVAVQPDGTFRFDGLDFGTYRIQGYDAGHRLRAIETNIVLDQNGVDVERNLSLAGMGSVIGQVVNPNGSPAGGQTVTVRGLNPQFGGFHTDLTDANGNYEVSGVIVGPFSVATGTGSLLGEAAGTIAFDGEVVQRDIVLVNSAVTLPTLRRDANSAPWDIRQGGHIGSSLSSVFVFSNSVSAPQGGFVLEVVANGMPIPFVGDTTFGTMEDGSREIVVRQQTTPLAGLAVTRKVFVPRSHFARYLEVLTNPTAAPITVDVRIRNNISTSSQIAPTLVATSSGDATIDLTNVDTADRWAVVRMGTDGDVFQNSAHRPSLAWVFDGPGAAARVAAVTLEPANPKSFVYSWNSVTIQPGQTVAFLHFGAQQYNQAAATASAQRLVQLPPEALVGLSPDEIAAVQNFVVPADASSTLDPLPAFGTSITGRMVEADGTTAMPHTSGSFNVRLRSNLIYFGREYSTPANTLGAFTFTHSGETINQVSLPLADFTLNATYAPTNVVSPPAIGTFVEGELVATRDIPFTNAAVVAGTVRRHTGAVVTTGGTVRIQNVGGIAVNTTVPIASDGGFRHTGIPAGNYNLTASLTQVQGQFPVGVLTGTATITTTAGQVHPRDITIVPTGTITGTLRTAAGVVVPNRQVDLRVGTVVHRFATTSTAGVFVFADVPSGVTYNLRAQDPITSFFTQADVIAVQDVTTVRDLTFLGFGTVSVTATASDGVPLAGASVRIRRATDPPTSNPTVAGTTNAAGQFTIPNVPIGTFLVRVVHPRTSNLFMDTPGSLPANGANVPLSFVLPAVSDLRVTATTSAGAPVPGAFVSVRRPGSTSFSGAGSTDANGQFTVQAVWGAYTLRVDHPSSVPSLGVEVPGEITASNLLIPVSVTLKGAGTITGVVRRADGQPAEFVEVEIRALNVSYGEYVSTDGDGAYEFEEVPPGAFVVVAADYDDEPYEYGSTRGEVAEGQSVQVDVVLDDVEMPMTLVDGNQRPWVILSDGSVAFELPDEEFTDPRYVTRIRQAGMENDRALFGLGFADPELGARQLAIFGQDFSDSRLHATRRVYVPADGYFVRYLDVVENFSSLPQTFGFGSFDENRFELGHQVLATSSGDLVTAADDRWWVTGVTQTGGAGRAFARVLSGAGGAIALADVQAPFAATSYHWGNITLQPGERAAILHFAVEARSAVSAQAAAERLAQLPPEALAGLTADQLALIRNFDVPAGGVSTVAPFPTFSGRVLSGDGVTPAAGAIVTVTSANLYLDGPLSSPASASGDYAITYPAVDGYTITVAGSPVTVTGTVPPGATSIVHDITLTGAGVLRGVVRFNGTPVANGEVRARHESTGFMTVVPIQANGSYEMAALEQGNHTVVAASQGRSSVPVTHSVQAGVVAVRDFNLTVFDGSVTVQVVAADGQTIMPQGRVFILDAVSGQVLAGPLLPDEDENYTYTSPMFGAAAGYRVRAEVTLSNGATAIAETTGTPFTFVGQVVPVTVQAAASVIRGVLTYDDGDEVEQGIVTLRRLTPQGTVDTYLSVTNNDGEFVFFGVPQGPFVLRGLDEQPSLLFTETSGVLSGDVLLIDLVLPPSGEVEVVVSGGSSIVVTLTSATSEPGVYVSDTASGGAAYFGDVPFGRFSVQACLVTAPLLCVSGNGELVQSGDNYTLVTLPPPFSGQNANFIGTLLDADGVTPLPNRQVVVSSGTVAPAAGVSTFTTDAAGQFRPPVFGTPAGPLVATGADPAPSFTSVTLTALVTSAFDLIVGSGVSATQVLQDSLGFQYSIGCDGALAGGAAPYPFAGYNALRLNGLGTRCLAAARAELEGRQIVYGPIRMNGLDVTRKVFVPADGSYVRYLEVLTNAPNPVFPQQDGPITIDLSLASRFVDPQTMVQGPEATGPRYFVASGGGAGSQAIADVVGGAGAAAAATVQTQLLGGWASKRYAITVPEGDTRILMHFVVLRAAGDYSGAEAQAQTLANLTDPAMLTGLSPADRARIVNFVVP